MSKGIDSYKYTFGEEEEKKRHLRRQIEDYLRKYASLATLQKVASILGIDVKEC